MLDEYTNIHQYSMMNMFLCQSWYYIQEKPLKNIKILIKYNTLFQ